MAAPTFSPNINWDHILSGSGVTVQAQRWEAIQKRTQALSRQGLTNFLALMWDVGWSTDPDDIACLDEAELVARCEGPLSATYLAFPPETRLGIDSLVSSWLGDNGYAGLNIALPCAGIAMAMGQYSLDTALTNPLP